ncbi:MAG TPA: hypothetical protein VJI75_03980 [Candidatus Nanoarchaeia archaeon]|nr:hypothetical protein [Candidatus Nanoarchaeia archaeon]
MKKILPFLPILALPFLLTGCLGDLLELSCIFVSDPSHCYQSAAIQKEDPYGCEKVKAPEGFTASNPPKDKCYLKIAEETGDYDVCDNIKGGAGSYTKEECVSGAALSQEDPSGCEKLAGTARESCRKTVGAAITPEKLTEINEEISDLQSDVGSDPDDAEATKKLKELEDKRKAMLDVMPAGTKADYFKNNREEIMGDVEDDDVRSEIVKEFTDYRKQNPTKDVDQLLDKLKEIKEQKDFVKNLDAQANSLVDQLKENAGAAAEALTEEQTEAIEEKVDALKEKSWEWFKDNGGSRLKQGMSQLEKMKERYDKASEQYEKISEQLDKIKKTYDELSSIYQNVDKYNKMIAKGEIDKGQARVLKGAVLLGKGLQYATEYVPVFGSTVSTITKETFATTIKLAEKRAKRTNALNKCIDDPENCDTEGISGY